METHPSPPRKEPVRLDAWVVGAQQGFQHQITRWRLGSLGTSFTSFGPRWRHPEWNKFNRARQQTDARGDRYLD